MCTFWRGAPRNPALPLLLHAQCAEVIRQGIRIRQAGPAGRQSEREARSLSLACSRASFFLFFHPPPIISLLKPSRSPSRTPGPRTTPSPGTGPGEGGGCGEGWGSGWGWGSERARARRQIAWGLPCFFFFFRFSRSLRPKSIAPHPTPSPAATHPLNPTRTGAVAAAVTRGAVRADDGVRAMRDMARRRMQGGGGEARGRGVNGVCGGRPRAPRPPLGHFFLLFASPPPPRFRRRAPTPARLSRPPTPPHPGGDRRPHRTARPPNGGRHHPVGRGGAGRARVRRPHRRRRPARRPVAPDLPALPRQQLRRRRRLRGGPVPHLHHRAGGGAGLDSVRWGGCGRCEWAWAGAPRGEGGGGRAVPRLVFFSPPAPSSPSPLPSAPASSSTREIRVSCPDATGLACDFARLLLDAGLRVAAGDVSTDG